VAVKSWLIDKSALVRIAASPDRDDWVDRTARGLLHLCTITRLEVAYSGRSAADITRQFAAPPLAHMLIDYCTPAIEERALEVQLLLAQKGQHRSAGLGDLLIAATAEAHGLTVLHVDHDFEIIAEVTGQAVERLRI
jgi:predicted nucleic acid-binding protein